MSPFSKKEYSDKEIQMFLMLGFEQDHLDYMLQNITATAIYNQAARKCLVHRLSGPAVESLRNCLIAWDTREDIKRNTPEWDQLIKL